MNTIVNPRALDPSVRLSFLDIDGESEVRIVLHELLQLLAERNHGFDESDIRGFFQDVWSIAFERGYNSASNVYCKKLRDEFAIAALQGGCLDALDGGLESDGARQAFVRACYAVADAMLAEREKDGAS